MYTVDIINALHVFNETFKYAQIEKVEVNADNNIIIYSAEKNPYGRKPSYIYNTHTGKCTEIPVWKKVSGLPKKA